MQCPKCRADMKIVVYREPVTDTRVEVDRCSGCGGLWFDASEREDLLEMRGSQQIDTGDPAVGREFNAIDRFPCPRCGGQMVRLVDPQQQHIWFEQCGQCFGSFLDAGEFADLKKETILDFFRGLMTRERR